MLSHTHTLAMASLAVQQTGVLGPLLAGHLLRRSSFHMSKERIEQLAALTADQAVDLLFDTAAPAPYMVKPLYAHQSGDSIDDWIDNSDSNNYETNKRRAVTVWWLRNAIFDNTAHHKVAFFLHTTFTTSHEGLSISGMGQNLTRDVSRYLYDHVRLLNCCTESQGGSNVGLKTIARKITLDNLMLGYLNNRQNIYNGVDESGLNENYAREFLELFTIGRGDQIAPGEYDNYTEADITVAAKVLSGFSTKDRRNLSDIDPDTGIYSGTAFPSTHFPGVKTFSNKFVGPNNPVTGVDMDEELDNFIEMVFHQPATALNYATKLYRFFFSIELDPAFIQEVANDLIANNYDYIATLKKMLKSAHFYSICNADPNHANGNLIKSPLEMLTEAISFFRSDLPDIDFNTPDKVDVYKHFRFFGTNYLFNSFGQNAGMILFGPPSVAGYPPYYQEPIFDRNWYTPGTIPTRFGLGQKWVNDSNIFPNLHTSIDAVAYADYLDALPGIDVSNADVILDKTLCLFPQAISTDRRNLIKDIFLDNLSPINWMIEWNNYKTSGNATAVEPHLRALVVAVLSAHEFQLK